MLKEEATASADRSDVEWEGKRRVEDDAGYWPEPLKVGLPITEMQRAAGGGSQVLSRTW